MAVTYTPTQSMYWNSPFLRYILMAIAAILVVSQLSRHHPYISSAWTHASKEGTASYNAYIDPNVKDAGNSTMGFERIIVINLPQRGDRRDRMSLVGAHTGIDLEYSDGLKGEDVDPKSMPPHWDPTMSMGNLGSYRSHVNALRSVVENGYRTAIIMEDDLDWDLGIKYQLPLFATNLKSIPPTQFTPLSQQAQEKTPHAPYGLDWDIMWLGTCIRPDPPPNAHFYKDPFSEETHYLWNTPGNVACSHAYAVTYESAKTLLAYALDINIPWDLHLSDFCKAHICPLISPPLIGFHQPAGAIAKSSDISSNDPTKYRENSRTIGIKHSALLDLTNNIEPKKVFPKFTPELAAK